MADTEKRNQSSENIDKMTIGDMLYTINDADASVAAAVRKEVPHIAKAVEKAEAALRQGGRIFYLGAGTSGRLGVLDASECPPTYSVPQSWFTGIIAGGDKALRTSVEGAEDDENLAAQELGAHGFCQKDLLVGIAASGRTPYVLSALAHARQMGCGTVLITNSKHLLVPEAADVLIAVDTGAEVVTGSTRMKAGTAQKMVLNMLSTATMVRMGKVYGNLMVDLCPSNEKLVDRARRIIVEATGCNYEVATAYLQKSENNVKTAVAMLCLDADKEKAEKELKKNDGVLSRALGKRC